VTTWATNDTRRAVRPAGRPRLAVVLLWALAFLGASKATAQTCSGGDANAEATPTDGTTIYARAQLAKAIQAVLATGDHSELDAADPQRCIREFLKNPLTPTGDDAHPYFVPTSAQLQQVQRAINTAHLELLSEDERNLAPEALPYARALKNMNRMPAPLEAIAGSGSAAFGLPSTGDLLAGLFNYLVHRAEDEVVHAALVELHNAMTPDTTYDKKDHTIRKIRKIRQGDTVMRALIPKSVQVLAQLDRMSVRQLLPALRTAALSDLENAPAALVKPPILDSPCSDKATAMAATAYADATHRKPQPLVECSHTTLAEYQLLALGVTLLNEVRAGQPPVAAFATLASTDVATLKSDNVRIPARVLGSLAREYRLSDGKARTDVIQDPELRRYFLAFLIDDAVLHGGHSNADLTARTHRIVQYVSEGEIDLSTALTDIRTLDSTVARLSDPRTAKSDTALISALATGVGLAGHVVTSALRFGVASDPVLRADVDAADSVLTDGIDLIRAAAQRDYEHVIIDGIAIVQRLAVKLPWTQTTVRYMTAAASLATAKTPADIETVLNDVAEPVGSARLKRGPVANGGVRTTFTLNAYLGAGGAWELTTTRGLPRAGVVAAGLAVPIGPEVAWGVKDFLPSISIFVPIVDLGLLANYRLSGDTLKTAPTVSWRQVLAPGVDIMFGLPPKDVPVSLGLGVQYGPDLRRANTTNEGVDVIRWQAFLAIDMPLFRF
jgi:hypothetical protein